MSDYRVKILTLIVALLSVAGLMQCGGGGGGSSLSTAAPATLTDNNVEAALVDIMAYVPACVPASPAAPVFGSPVIPDPIRQATRLIALQGRSLRSKIAASVRASETTTIPPTAGSCGGSLSGSITTDNVAGTLSGSIVFDNFCQDTGSGGNATLNGNLAFDGSVSGSSISLNASSSGIQLTSLSENFSASFDVSLGMNLDDGSATVALHSFSATKGGGKTISGSNVVLTITPDTDPSRSRVDLSGTITDSVYGSMVVDTVDPIITSGTGSLISGSGTVTGANNTEVKITIVGENIFQVGLDGDGDDLYDEYGETVDCSALDVSSLIGLIGF